MRARPHVAGTEQRSGVNRRAPSFTLGRAATAALTGLIDDQGSSEDVRRRAQIVLLAAAGASSSSIAEQLGCSPQTVVTWRERYRQGGLSALSDEPRPGRPPGVDPALVVVRTLHPPPAGRNRWTIRSLAEELGVGSTAVADVWRGWGIAPEAGGVVLLTDPVLDEVVVDVAGLYVDASVRLLAVATGPRVATDDDPEPALPIERRPVLGGRLSRLEPASACAGSQAAFLAGLSATPGLRVVASEEGADLPWPGDRLHIVRAPARWPRTVRVACLLAGATTRGASSVTRLRRALDGYPGEAPFHWCGSPRSADQG